jgi:two-component system, NtrC family, response regulator AtoC
MNMPGVLIVDDDQNVQKMLHDIIRQLAVDIVTASDAESAISLLGQQIFDLVITDLKMPGKNGMALLEHCLKICPSVPIIMVSAFGSIESAVDAMKKGAYDFITKPFDSDELLQIVKKALSVSKKNKELISPYFDHAASFVPTIIGGSSIIAQVLNTVKKVAQADSSVLISGETGVGKELVARAIHLASPRRSRPFIKVNCAAIPEALLESDLFGFEKGSFTGAICTKPGRFELASEGTIFLDEIGELPLGLQAKLLAVLQDRAFERIGGVKTIQVDVRIVAASNKDLALASRNGMFRSDLFYRLNVVPLSIPPLRERREDILMLAEYFIDRLVRKYKRPMSIPPELMGILIAHNWPGNIRELENVMERMFVLSEGSTLELRLLPEEMRFESAVSQDSSFKTRVESATRIAEKQMIVNALSETDQNRTRAARKLGISRRTLLNKIKEFGL